MDYWGMPHAKTNLQPCVFGIDIANGVAAIPGDGNDVICMIYTYDLANYLVRMLELEDWPEFSVFVGDQVTYNEILAIAEDIRGKLESNCFKKHWLKDYQLGEKFNTSYDGVDQINAGSVTVPPMPSTMGSPEELKEVTVLVSRLTVAGVFDLPKDNRMSDRFPEVRPVKFKEFMAKCWVEKQPWYRVPIRHVGLLGKSEPTDFTPKIVLQSRIAQSPCSNRGNSKYGDQLFYRRQLKIAFSHSIVVRAISRQRRRGVLG